MSGWSETLILFLVDPFGKDGGSEGGGCMLCFGSAARPS